MPTAAVNAAAASTPPPKRLSFDRRYGWVFDECKEPSEEALSGGRGMQDGEKQLCRKDIGTGNFATLPNIGLESIHPILLEINFVGSSTMEALERPEVLSPKVVQVTLNDQMHKFVSSVKNAKLDLMVLGRSNKKEFTSSSNDNPVGNTGSHTEPNLG